MAVCGAGIATAPARPRVIGDEPEDMGRKHTVVFSLMLGIAVGACGTQQDSVMCDVLAREGTAGIEEARQMIKHGAFVNARFAKRNGATCLMVITSVPEAVQMLLDSGADPNIRDFGNDTALRYAAGQGHVESVKILIRFGADVNNRSRQGVTPLSIAIERGHDEVARLLRSAGAEE
jgi:ankyrin repeat protein